MTTYSGKVIHWGRQLGLPEIEESVRAHGRENMTALSGVRSALPVVTVERQAPDRGVEVLGAKELCHDLRHPASVIEALVAAVQVECELPPQAVARLGQISAEAKRIVELCRTIMLGATELVEFSRLDRIAADVVGSVQLRHRRIHVVVAPAVAPIDDVAARRILWNLVDNACRASGPDGAVVVFVRSTATGVRLEVADSGPGFGHAEPGMAALGLSIVRATAERYGGTLAIGDSELGGALVTVTFPPPRLDLTEPAVPDDWSCVQIPGEGEAS